MVERTTETPKPPSTVSLVCLLLFGISGLTISKVIAANYFPPAGSGFNVIELALAGVGGAIGGGIGGAVAWVIERLRK